MLLGILNILIDHWTHKRDMTQSTIDADQIRMSEELSRPDIDRDRVAALQSRIREYGKRLTVLNSELDSLDRIRSRVINEG